MISLSLSLSVFLFKLHLAVSQTSSRRSHFERLGPRRKRGSYNGHEYTTVWFGLESDQRLSGSGIGMLLVSKNAIERTDKQRGPKRESKQFGQAAGYWRGPLRAA